MSVHPPLDDSPPAPPPPPRMSGRGPAVVGIVVFLATLTMFGLVLIGLNVLPSPLRGQPAPVTTVDRPSPIPKSARFAQPGECVVNNGSDSSPQLIMVACASGVLEIIDRFDGTADPADCRQVPDYRFHYFYDSELAGLDFVLCMKKRP